MGEGKYMTAINNGVALVLANVRAEKEEKQRARYRALVVDMRSTRTTNLLMLFANKTP